MKTGAGGENQVQMVTKGNQANVLIDGKKAVTFSGQPLEGDTLSGFKVTSGPEAANAVAFADPKISQS
jgi:hypothetical protein